MVSRPSTRASPPPRRHARGEAATAKGLPPALPPGFLAFLVTIAIWYLIFRQPITPLPSSPRHSCPATRRACSAPPTPVPWRSARPATGSTSRRRSGDRTLRPGLRRRRQQDRNDGLTARNDRHGSLSRVRRSRPPGRARCTSPIALAGTIYVYDRDGLYQREFLSSQSPARTGSHSASRSTSAGTALRDADLSGPYQKILVIDRTANIVRTIGENEKAQLPERDRRR